MKKNENAFTGLEAAIVLIAFVVVAAVFSYVMLGAGFFTAQKAQDVVHSGIGQAASSIEIVGDVYGFENTSGGKGLGTVQYTIALTSGMSPMNISAMRVTYADATQRTTPEYKTKGSTIGPAAAEWTIQQVFDEVTTDTILEPGEKFLLTVGVPNTPQNMRFTISMQPEMGALLTVVRTAPASIYPVNILR